MTARFVRVSDLTGPAATAVKQARQGRRVLVTAKGAVVAEIGPPAADDFETEPPEGPVVFGSMKGSMWIAPDFDAPLEDFAPYR